MLTVSLNPDDRLKAEKFHSITGFLNKPLTAEILEENGFNVLPSKSNFLFASHNSIFAYDIFQKMRDKGILVRYFSKPKIDNYLRISIGSEEEMELFCKDIIDIVKK